ncbi:MAG: D-amino acid aminotransferase [Burkholderiales bacterium]|nr:D-amino acid aminotransferase [Burkholderiales bacterium]
MIYLNGVYMPIEDAKIPVLDRGFIFGDGVYEMIPVYSRRPFRLRDHLSRLGRSLEGIRLPNPLSDEDWIGIVEKLVKENDPDDQGIYIQVTRGVAKRDHAFPKEVSPTVFAMSNPLTSPAQDALEAGVAAIAAEDYRWLRCDIKTVSLLANVLLRQLAVDAGAAETILFRDGFLTEGAASSVFVVKEGILLAPPKSHLMLPGITYDVVLEIAEMEKIPFEIRNISREEVFSCSEILLTSSTMEITPATTLDASKVGTGRPGPVFSRLHAAYQDFKTKVMRKS